MVDWLSYPRWLFTRLQNNPHTLLSTGIFFDSLWKRPRLIIPHQLIHFLHEGIATEVFIYDDAILSDEE